MNKKPQDENYYNYNVNKYNSKEDLSSLDIKEISTDLYLKKCIPLIDVVETYQGEGPNCGKRMVLTRFKYCNHRCPFCDTYDMMLKTPINRYSLKDIDVLLRNSNNLMITGGEPTINAVDPENRELVLSQFFATVVMAATLKYEYLDIETNGINLEKLQRYITAFCDVTRVNISWSPKFINEESKDYNYDLLLKLKNTNDGLLYPMPTLKLVVGKDDMNDYNQFAYDAVIKYGYDPNKIYLMPKGTTLDEINESMKYLLDIASDIKCNVSSKLHVIHNFK
jgi:organic radical activating enzyme